MKPRAAAGKRRGTKAETLSRTLHARGRVGTGGRIVIPAEMRKQLGLKAGTRVSMKSDGDSFTVMSIDAALREVQNWVRKLVPAGVSLSEELMAERKEEFKRE